MALSVSTHCPLVLNCGSNQFKVQGWEDMALEALNEPRVAINPTDGVPRMLEIIETLLQRGSNARALKTHAIKLVKYIFSPQGM